MRVIWFTLSVVFFLLESCNQPASNKKVAVKKPIIEKLLPDSSFNSVQESLTFEVKVFDLTGPPMKSLKSKYSREKGVLAFRGASSRDVVEEGHLSARPSEIKAEWEFDTEYNGKKTNLGVWGGGSGWTGQPLIINWDYKGIPASAQKHNPGANKEVIISSLCGKIYFLDFEKTNTINMAAKNMAELGKSLMNLTLGNKSKVKIFWILEKKDILNSRSCSF
jgi:hypothetical protein